MTSPEIARSRKDNGAAASASKSPKSNSTPAKGRPPKSSSKKGKGNEAKTARESTLKMVGYSLLFAILAMAGSIVILKGVSLHQDYFANRLAAKSESATNTPDQPVVNDKPTKGGEKVESNESAAAPPPPPPMVEEEETVELDAEDVAGNSEASIVDEADSYVPSAPSDVTESEEELHPGLSIDATIDTNQASSHPNAFLSETGERKISNEKNELDPNPIIESQTKVIDDVKPGNINDARAATAAATDIDSISKKDEIAIENNVERINDELEEPEIENVGSDNVVDQRTDRLKEENVPGTEPVVKEVEPALKETEAENEVKESQPGKVVGVVEEKLMGQMESDMVAGEDQYGGEKVDEGHALDAEEIKSEDIEHKFSPEVLEREGEEVINSVEVESEELRHDVEEEEDELKDDVEEDDGLKYDVEEKEDGLNNDFKNEKDWPEDDVEEEEDGPEDEEELELDLDEDEVGWEEEEEDDGDDESGGEFLDDPEGGKEEKGEEKRLVDLAPIVEELEAELATTKEKHEDVEEAVSETQSVLEESVDVAQDVLPDEEVVDDTEPMMEELADIVPGVLPKEEEVVVESIHVVPDVLSDKEAAVLPEGIAVDEAESATEESNHVQDVLSDEEAAVVPEGVAVDEAESAMEESNHVQDVLPDEEAAVLSEGEAVDEAESAMEESNHVQDVMSDEKAAVLPEGVAVEAESAMEGSNHVVQDVMSDEKAAVLPEGVAVDEAESAMEGSIHVQDVLSDEEAAVLPEGVPVDEAESAMEESEDVQDVLPAKEKTNNAESLSDENVVVTLPNLNGSSTLPLNEAPASTPSSLDPQMDQQLKATTTKQSLSSESASASIDVDAESYFRRDSTNDADFHIRSSLDALEELFFLAQHQEDDEGGSGGAVAVESVLEEFNSLIAMYPSSPRAIWGKARCLDELADRKGNNALLDLGILAYQKVVDSEETPLALFSLAAKRLVNRLQFRGKMGTAIKVQKKLLATDPDDLSVITDLGILYELAEHSELSRPIFEKVLEADPTNPLASVYLGYQIKKNEGKNRKAIELLDRGIKTNAPGTQAERFYSALGDALVRVGRRKDADSIYEDGTNIYLFIDKYQRPLYKENIPETKTWWTEKNSGVQAMIHALKSSRLSIRSEAIAIAKRGTFFSSVMENIVMTGGIREFPLFFRGNEAGSNCYYAPETCSVLKQFPELLKCSRCQIKFQMLLPNTYVWPVCGPTTGRLRMQIGLVIPTGPDVRSELRVGLPDSGAESWTESDFLIFDDSFEQEIWVKNPGVKQGEVDQTKAVLLLSVDVWHPNLPQKARDSLGPIPF